MKIKLLLLIIVSMFASLVVLSSCQNSAISSEPKIVGTLPIVSSIAEQIVNNTPIKTVSVLKGTENPHTYDLKPQDAILFSRASLILSVGGIDSWASKIINSSNITSMSLLAFEKNPIKNNPHIWFDFNAVLNFSKNLTDYLSKKYPQYKSNFEENYASFSLKLKNIKKSYNLSSKRVAQIAPTFNYLFREFSINDTATLLSDPEAEATINQIIAFISELKKNNVSCVVNNELLGTKYSDIVSEKGFDIVELSPFVGPVFSENIISLYKNDLNNIKNCTSLGTKVR